MSIALAILSSVLALGSVLNAVVAPVLVLLAKRRFIRNNEDRSVSGTPVLGSVLGFVAILLAPIRTIGDRLTWSWAPLAIEASVLALLFAYWKLSGLAREADRQRRSRLP